MKYGMGKRAKSTDARGAPPARRAKPTGAIGGIMQLQRTAGNQNVSRLLGMWAIQRKKISEEGYGSVCVTRYFQRIHLASNERGARAASLSRSDQYGRGLRNTVIEGTVEDVKDKVKDADYDNDTYHIRGNQWGVKINANYWDVEMMAGSAGNVIKSMEKTSGDIYIKAYFDERNKIVTVTGIDG